MKKVVYTLFFVVYVAHAGYGWNAQSGLVVFDGNGFQFSAASGEGFLKKGAKGTMQSTKDVGALHGKSDNSNLDSKDDGGLLCKSDLL